MVITIGSGSKTSYVLVEHMRTNKYLPTWEAVWGSDYSYPEIESVLVIDGVRITAHEIHHLGDPTTDYGSIRRCQTLASFYFICKFDGDWVEKELNFYYPGEVTKDIFDRETRVKDRLGFGPFPIMIRGRMEDVYQDGKPLLCEYFDTGDCYDDGELTQFFK